MSHKEAVYFTSICDRCGREDADGDYSAWISKESADLNAEYGEWHIEGGNHICPRCLPLDREEQEDDDELDPQHGEPDHKCAAA